MLGEAVTVLEYTLEIYCETILKTKLLLVVQVIFFFVSGNVDNTVPDHSFLFPEFEIVIETEDEITPEISEKEDEPEIIGSMGKKSVSELYSLNDCMQCLKQWA